MTMMHYTSPHQTLLLLDLGDGPLSHILTYLNPREVGTVEQTCRGLCKLTPIAWNQLDRFYTETTSPTSSAAAVANHRTLPGWFAGPSRVFPSSPRDRAIRFFKASQASKKLERVASPFHYDWDDPERCHVRCFGCQHFPNRLDARVFDSPDKFEFFLRLSYRKQSCFVIATTGNNSNKNKRGGAGLDHHHSNENVDESLLIWQGFCPPVNRVVGGRWNSSKLYFDLKPIYDSIHWSAMRAFLKLVSETNSGVDSTPGGAGIPAEDYFDGHNDNNTTDIHPDVLALLYEAIDNLSVTVVAVEKINEDEYSPPLHKTSLVVSTGGFHDILVTTPQDAAPDFLDDEDFEEDGPTTITSTATSRRRNRFHVDDDDRQQHRNNRRTKTNGRNAAQQQTYLLHPRNISTHGMSRDEDWIQVQVHTEIEQQQPMGARFGYTLPQQRVHHSSSTTTPSRTGYVRGLTLSHEC